MTKGSDVAREAGDGFSAAVDDSFRDVERERLFYHLRRLSPDLAGDDEEKDLVELARLAFQESDVSEAAARIKQRPDASPLAFAIADIVNRAETGVGGRVGRKPVMFGAVLGAYTSLARIQGVDRSTAAALGAIGGAIATSTMALIDDFADRRAWAEYLRTDD